MKDNPRIKAAKAARITRASVTRVRRWIKGIPCSSSQGGHNKKLDMLSLEALKEYLLMCYALGKGASIDNVLLLQTRFYNIKESTRLPRVDRRRTSYEGKANLLRLFDLYYY